MKFKDALLRTAMMAATPESKEELVMIADALRIWRAHPELHGEVMKKFDVKPERMLTRIGMVLALVKLGVEPMPDMPEDYTPGDPSPCPECGMNVGCKPSCTQQTYPIDDEDDS